MLMLIKIRQTFCFYFQRQQVVLTRQWAKANPIIHFSVMHPGWVDTPGNIWHNVIIKLLLCGKCLFLAVSTSMPEFHRMMEGRLRTLEQGADTVVWLALCRAASRTSSGQFFQGVVNQNHLDIMFCAGIITN